MSSNKELAEHALRFVTRLAGLAIHEKFGVVALMNTMIAIEAKNAETASPLNAQQQHQTPPADEHYQYVRANKEVIPQQ